MATVDRQIHQLQAGVQGQLAFHRTTGMNAGIVDNHIDRARRTGSQQRGQEGDELDAPRESVWPATCPCRPRFLSVALGSGSVRKKQAWWPPWCTKPKQPRQNFPFQGLKAIRSLVFVGKACLYPVRQAALMPVPMRILSFTRNPASCISPANSLRLMFRFEAGGIPHLVT
jgi:hypothetical protein